MYCVSFSTYRYLEKKLIYIYLLMVLDWFSFYQNLELKVRGKWVSWKNNSNFTSNYSYFITVSTVVILFASTARTRRKRNFNVGNRIRRRISDIIPYQSGKNTVSQIMMTTFKFVTTTYKALRGRCRNLWRRCHADTELWQESPFIIENSLNCLFTL